MRFLLSFLRFEILDRFEHLGLNTGMKQVELSVQFGSDAYLVEQIQAGNKDAFNLLWVNHSDAVFNFTMPYTNGRREIAREISQEVAIRLFRNIDKIDNAKSLNSWLFKIAKHLAIDYHRKRKKEVLTADPILSVRSTVSSHQIAKERMDATNAIRGALTQIRTIYSDVLSRRLAEMSCAEIAADLDIPEGTVFARLSRGRAMMRNVLEKEAA